MELHDKIEQGLEELAQEVSKHLTLQQSGVVGDLKSLEPSVRQLCGNISKIAVEEAEQYKARLQEVMSEMRQMKEILAVKQNEVADDLAKLDIKRKAQNSYLNRDVANDNLIA